MSERILDEETWARDDSPVICETHGRRPHIEQPDCVWPHYWAPGVLPSMTAAETLDPRDAVIR